MNEVIVRELQFEDRDGVRKVDELTQRMYQGKKWDMLDEKEKEKFMVSRRSEFKINCKTDFSFVALRGHKILGFLFAHENLPFTDEIYVRHIAVHPDFQKQGIGKKLYAALINKAKAKGKKEVKALINPDNPPSIKLHKQIGFKVIDWKRAILEL